MIGIGTPRRAVADPAVWVATVCGAGFFPLAPATFTSFLLTLLLLVLGDAALGLRILLLGVFIFLGTWAAQRAEPRYGHDARCIVIDEVAGLWLGVLLVPWDLPHLAAGFFLFRVFDVLKPPPAYQLQALPGGWGVMADDIAAGAYTLIVLWLARALLPAFG